VQIKTFEANSMAEALQAAKKAFGPQAVILGVKTQKASARLLGGWKKRKVTLTAATDTPPPDQDTVSLSHNGGLPAGHMPARQNRGSNPSVVRTFSSPLASSPAKQMLPPGYINKLFWMQQQMQLGDIDREIVKELMAGIHQQAAQKTQISDTLLLELLKTEIKDRIRRTPAPSPPGLPSKTVVFIGPTGVGKTTTIAKIAALYNHNLPSSVGLITLDDQRIGGMSQLATFARIIGIPVKAAASPAALRRAIQKLAQKRLILVDTGGANPHDQEQIDRLDTLLMAIEQPRIHLVVSTTTKSSDLNIIVDAFKKLPVQDLLFTKVDESTTQGNILSQSLRSGLPLSYYTDGRDIPEDIHMLSADSLIRMIFNETSLRRAKAAAPEILAERLQAFESELETIPMAYQPYRSYSTGLANIPRGYANMAESNG
jgi:flagellar biosynthesis protein FlhF